jgi:hypothetical protein
MATVTIDVDDELYARAQRLAEARKISVAEMLERMLRVAAAPPLDRSQLPPLTRQALGMLSPITDDDFERTLEEEILRKHGSR